MLTQIINAKILTPQGWLKNGSVILRDNKILEVTNCDLAVIGADLIDAKGMCVVPGFIDMHFHGAMGFETTTDDPKAMPAIGEAKLREGVTNCCPTT